MKLFGKSVIQAPMFSTTDMQLVLNENKALKTDLSRSEELNKELVEACKTALSEIIIRNSSSGKLKTTAQIKLEEALSLIEKGE